MAPMLARRRGPFSGLKHAPVRLSTDSKARAEARATGHAMAHAADEHRNRGRHMIRKLLLPLAAVVLLGGCVTSGYSYLQGSGDYYYGAPSVEYRYHTPYGYGYPYGYYGYGGSAYGYRYASPYRYRQYYPDPYRHYYYGYPYRQPNYYYRRPAPRPTIDRTPDRARSPWRDLNRLGRRGMGGDGEPTQMPSIVPPTARPSPQPHFNPEPRGESRARSGRVR